MSLHLKHLLLKKTPSFPTHHLHLHRLPRHSSSLSPPPPPPENSCPPNPENPNPSPFSSNFSDIKAILKSSPPNPPTGEKYLHPDHMSSAEKKKLELIKEVRNEFKMSESDCGSARVQGRIHCCRLVDIGSSKINDSKKNHLKKPSSSPFLHHLLPLPRFFSSGTPNPQSQSQSQSQSLVAQSPSPSLAAFQEVLKSRITSNSIPYKKDKNDKRNEANEIFSYMDDLGYEEKGLIKDFLSIRMKKGKGTKNRSIVYGALRRLARTERDVSKLLVDAVENVKPICEVRKVKKGSTTYDVPAIVPWHRKRSLALRWMFGSALKRRGSGRTSLEKCIFAETLDAYRKRGITFKRRESLHGLASANRGFAHFRWW